MFFINILSKVKAIVKTRTLFLIYLTINQIIMRKLLLGSFALLLLTTACNNNKKPGDVTIKGKDGESVTINTNDASKNVEEMKNSMEELQKLKPLSLEELKALIPAEIMGAKQDDYNAVNYAGYGQASASYKINDSTKIKLNVIDCAGNAGAGFYNMQFLMNFEQDNENEYTKSTTFNDQKAIENCKKKRKECSFTYFSGNRFLVALEGDNVGIDQLKDVAKGLNIK